MLHAGHHILPAVVALKTANHGFSDAAAEKRVFAVALGYAAPPGVEGDVYHGAVHPVDALCRCLPGGYPGPLFDGFEIPAARLGERNGEHRLIAVYDILPEEQRYAQSAFLDSHFLKGPDLVHALHVEHGSEPAISRQVGQRTLHHRPRGDVAAGQ